MDLQSVFVLQREWFWNDIDHVSGYSIVDVFTSESLAKDCAQIIYVAENPDRVFDALKWVSAEAHIETALEVDKYRDTSGNFMIKEYVIHATT